VTVQVDTHLGWAECVIGWVLDGDYDLCALEGGLEHIGQARRLLRESA